MYGERKVNASEQYGIKTKTSNQRGEDVGVSDRIMMRIVAKSSATKLMRLWMRSRTSAMFFFGEVRDFF